MAAVGVKGLSIWVIL